MKTIHFNLLIVVFIIIGKQYKAQAPPIQWQKCYGGTGGEYAYSIKQTNDSGYIVIGQANSINGVVTGMKGMGDIWLTKLDKSGSLQWQKCYGGTQEDIGVCVLQTQDGGYLLEGYSKSNNGDILGNKGGWDGILIKTDNVGNIVWQKCFGGTLDEYFSSIVSTTDGGYLLFGYTFSNNGDVSGNKGSSDLWVIKINLFGSIIWQRCYGGTSNDGVGLSVNSIMKYEKDFVLVGNSSSSDGDLNNNKGITDLWVVRIDSVGNLKWQSNFGGTNSDFGRGVVLDKDSNIVILGETRSNDVDVTFTYGLREGWLLKLSNSGGLLSQKNFGGSGDDIPYDLIRTNDKGFGFIGASGSIGNDATGNHGLYDVWFVKLDSNLNKQWHHCYGGSGTEQAYSLIETKDGGYAFCGYATTNNGDVSGCNSGPGDFWVVKLGSMSGLEEKEIIRDVLIYPNPSNGALTVKINVASFYGEVEIYDSLGQLVSVNKIEDAETRINVHSLSKGIYFYVLKSHLGGIVNGKLILD